MTTRDEISMGASEQTPSVYPSGKTYLFFMAIDEYQNGVRRLNNAVRDAEAVKDCLLKHYEFDAENLVFLKNEKATKKNMYKQFDRYTELITKADNLLFYFSGHGYFHPNNQKGYWLTFNSISEEVDSYFGNDEVISYIKNIKARHIFGIVDACFSEALFNTRDHRPQQSRRYNLPSRWLLTAGRLKPVSDGPPGKHSPFAETLLNYLINHTGSYLWVSELCMKVVDLVEFNSRQIPRGEALSNVGHGGGEFLFLRKGESLPKIVDVATDKYKTLNIPSREQRFLPESDILSFNQLKKTLGESLEDNNWKLVLNQLRQGLHYDGNKLPTLRLLIARYNRIVEKDVAQTHSSDYIEQAYNKLHYDLNTFIKGLTDKDLR